MAFQLGTHIKAALFDLDDTLVQTIAVKWRQHKFVARKFYGKELTDAELRKHWGKPMQQLVCELYDTDDAEQALANVATCYDDYKKTLFDKSLPYLDLLKSEGVRVGVVTAAHKMAVDKDMSYLPDLRERLEYIQTSSDTDVFKPDPRVFDPAIEWLASLAIAPHETVYVGDAIKDYIAAIGAGFAFVGVETGLVSRHEFAAVGATSVSNIADLSY